MRLRPATLWKTCRRKSSASGHVSDSYEFPYSQCLLGKGTARIDGKQWPAAVSRSWNPLSGGKLGYLEILRTHHFDVARAEQALALYSLWLLSKNPTGPQASCPHDVLMKSSGAFAAGCSSGSWVRSPPPLPTIPFAQNDLAISRGGKRRQ